MTAKDFDFSLSDDFIELTDIVEKGMVPENASGQNASKQVNPKGFEYDFDSMFNQEQKKYPKSEQAKEKQPDDFIDLNGYADLSPPSSSEKESLSNEDNLSDLNALFEGVSNETPKTLRDYEPDLEEKLIQKNEKEAGAASARGVTLNEISSGSFIISNFVDELTNDTKADQVSFKLDANSLKQTKKSEPKKTNLKEIETIDLDQLLTEKTVSSANSGKTDMDNIKDDNSLVSGFVDELDDFLSDSNATASAQPKQDLPDTYSSLDDILDELLPKSGDAEPAKIKKEMINHLEDDLSQNLSKNNANTAEDDTAKLMFEKLQAETAKIQENNVMLEQKLSDLQAELQKLQASNLQLQDNLNMQKETASTKAESLKDEDTLNLKLEQETLTQTEFELPEVQVEFNNTLTEDNKATEDPGEKNIVADLDFIEQGFEQDLSAETFPLPDADHKAQQIKNDEMLNHLSERLDIFEECLLVIDKRLNQMEEQYQQKLEENARSIVAKIIREEIAVLSKLL